MSEYEKPIYRERQNQAARAGLEEPAVQTKRYPDTWSQTESNQSVRAAGWCPECKEMLAECACDPGEPGSLFEERS